MADDLSLSGRFEWQVPSQRAPGARDALRVLTTVFPDGEELHRVERATNVADRYAYFYNDELLALADEVRRRRREGF